MTQEISPLNTSNFADMARAMGMSADMEKAPAKASTLSRLRIWNKPVMGQVEVSGKKKNMEILSAGSYRLQLADDKFIYAEQADIRVFVQRFMYKRYDDKKNMYVKTLMAEDLNGDLKDNVGGYNCGKPAGYIEDWQSLSDDKKKFFKSIKRVRVLLGEVKFTNAVDQDGNEIDAGTHPFIWEIDNAEAFKTMGEPFAKLGKNKHLPVQHWISCTSKQGGEGKSAIEYYVPEYSLDISDSIELEEADQTRFSDFIDWIGNYNQYIVDAHNNNARGLSDDDASLVDELIEIDGD